ncbi:AIPR family protein [Achromobacter aegrifaciens]|uniref:AIPR family protein n=1 Tax=Achromobacter aegrifaciens TaxID=1287736 RepID=UPI00320B3B90
MSDNVLAFRQDVISRVLSEVGEEVPAVGFATVIGQMLEEAEECVDYMPCPFRGTGARRRNLGVDGYSFDEADGSLRIVITVFGGKEEPTTVTQTTARTEFAKLTAFIEEALAGNDDYLPTDEDPVVDFVDLLQTHRTSISRLRLYLVTDGLLSGRIRDWPESTLCAIPTDFYIWDMARLHGALSSQGGREALTVDFAQLSEGGIPCLQASLLHSEYSAYLCVIPGDTLAQIYDTYGSRLLEGNVRSFLGKIGKVNKAIRETILREPGMFFAFNNGISATASSVAIEKTANGPRLMSATDLQIVNGGQTTASLTFTKRKEGSDLSAVFVQMKLSVVPEELSGGLIPKISEYANKQNKVSDSDLFSNHEYHRKLEELSRRIKAPPPSGSQRPTSWFYERAKGQYRIETAKMSPAEKQRFEVDNPKSQLLTKTDIAKVENSWRCLPHEVSKGAQKNFDVFSKYIVMEWSTKPLQFNDEYFRKIVAHTIVFRTLEKLISTEAWYEGGYRANIVTYSIAKLCHMLETSAAERVLDYQGIWRQQTISHALREQLRLIARSMYTVITTPDQEGSENITEWSKKALAWDRAQQARVELLPEFAAELVSAEEAKHASTDAEEDAAIDRGLAAITKVLATKPSDWRQIRQWGLERRFLTPKEEQLLLVAATPRRLPTDRQAEAILKIRRILESEGLVLS